jgi:6-phosphogluconolactonase
MRWIALVGLLGCDAGTPAVGADALPDTPVTSRRLISYTSGKSSITKLEHDPLTGAGVNGSGLGTPTDQDTTFLAFAPGAVYAVAESQDRVNAFAMNADGELTFVDTAGSGGSGPAHVAVDGDATHVLVSNYGSGDIIVYPVGADGAFGTPTTAVNAGANAHQMVVDPSNRFVFVPCLGDDRVVQFTYSGGVLAPNGAFVTSANAGPRHLAFAPDGVHAYLVNELASTLTALRLDANGQLSEITTVSMRAGGATGTNTGAEVAVHPSGKFVYASNRGDDNIAIFDAALAPLGHASTLGNTPRSFAIDPSGRLLFVANQTSGDTKMFFIDNDTGALTSADVGFTFDGPAFVGFVAL